MAGKYIRYINVSEDQFRSLLDGLRTKGITYALLSGWHSFDFSSLPRRIADNAIYAKGNAIMRIKEAGFLFHQEGSVMVVINPNPATPEVAEAMLTYF